MTDFGPGVRRVTGQIRDELTATAPRNAATVTVHVTAGDPEPGYWCDRCLLPSAVELPIHGLHEHGVMELGRLRACPDCGTIDRA